MTKTSAWKTDDAGFVTVSSSDDLFKFWIKDPDVFVTFGINTYSVINPEVALKAIAFEEDSIEEIVVFDELTKQMLLLKELITEAASK